MLRRIELVSGLAASAFGVLLLPAALLAGVTVVAGSLAQAA